MGLQVYFLRHGETPFSISGGFCGELDLELTDPGKAMAEEFARAYAHMPWQAIFTSPMKRTAATAAPLCKALGMEPQVRAGLREMSFGDWEEKARDEVKSQYLEDYIRWMTEPAWNSPPGGGETAVEVANRAMSVMAEIEDTCSNGPVLVVSHKTTIRIILCQLLGIDLGRYRDRIDCLAGSISIVKFDEHGPLLQRLGDRAYMSDALQERLGT
ncbi:histidine phosphatase family protein [Acaryochloris marina]|uniref:histidine phosphatase family protein n=1 Tax=Acaryochloris marina TaxID=155978 RepID=UPI001BAE6718|nr:histidine phosphatase family protein [Acaryochloris marina]QUY44297.1 histidine phosphatase family protein [Acaryochloris marina S15]